MDDKKQKAAEKVLFEYGQLISYVMNIAKDCEDKDMKERIFRDMNKHIVLYNNTTRVMYI